MDSTSEPYGTDRRARTIPRSGAGSRRVAQGPQFVTLYVDTSALAKPYIDDADSADLIFSEASWPAKPTSIRWP